MLSLDSIVLYVGRLIEHERGLLWGILIVALLLRVGIAFVFPQDIVRVDAEGYVLSAQRLLAGGGYMYGDGSGFDVPPLYPMFLASLFAIFGPSLLAVRLVQAFLALLSYGLIYVVAKGWFDKSVGLGALFLSSFYPALVVWPGFLLTETLYMFTIALFFFFLYRLSQRLTWYDALGCGVSLGLSLLTREILLFYPLLLVPLILTRPRRLHILGYAALVIVGTSLILLPWLWRNYRMTGHFVYTSRVSYVQHLVTGRGYLTPKYAAAVGGASRSPSEDTLARWEKYGKVAENLDLRFILSQPGTFVCRMFNRFVEYWFHPNGLWSLPGVFMVRTLYATGHAVLIIMAMIGIVITIWYRQRLAWGLVMVLGYITVLNLTTYGPNPRYNLPFLPIVFIFSAQGIAQLLSTLSNRYFT